MAQLTGAPPPATIEPLTAREIEALRLAAQCFTNKAIGVQMGIRYRTGPVPHHPGGTAKYRPSLACFIGLGEYRIR